MVEVIIKLGVIDGVYVDMSVDTRKEFSEKGIMPLGISSMGRVEFLRLVTGFRDGQGLPGPVNDGVGGMELGES